MILYKLTRRNNTTYNDCKWGKNITRAVTGKGTELCSNQVIHAYRSLNLALLLNPIHGNYIPCNIWEAEGKIVSEDWGKVGVHELKTTRRLRQPDWYANRKTRQHAQIQFAILCAEAALKYFEEQRMNDDRPRKAIQAAKKYLKNPNKLNARAAVRAAADAARAAAGAVRAAADAAAGAAACAAADAAAGAAACAAAYAAADAAVYAVRAAVYAARAAVYAARAAAYAADRKPNFSTIADRAVNVGRYGKQ